MPKIPCQPKATAAAGAAKISHSAQMSPSVRPLPQCRVSFAVMTGNGVGRLFGGSS